MNVDSRPLIASSKENEDLRKDSRCKTIVIVILAVAVVGLIIANVVLAVENGKEKKCSTNAASSNAGSNGIPPSTNTTMSPTKASKPLTTIATTSTSQPMTTMTTKVATTTKAGVASTSQPGTTTTRQATSTTTQKPTGSPTRATCTSPKCYRLAAQILSGIDTRVNPCDDFDNYMCGSWKEDNDWKLAYQGSASIFGGLDTHNNRIVLDALVSNETILSTSKAAQKAVKYFSTCSALTVLELKHAASQLAKSYSNVSEFNIVNHTYAGWNSVLKQALTNAMAEITLRNWNPWFKWVTLAKGLAVVDAQVNLKGYTDADIQTLLAPHRPALEAQQKQADPNASILEFWSGFESFVMRIRDLQSQITVTFQSDRTAFIPNAQPLLSTLTKNLTVINFNELEYAMFFKGLNRSLLGPEVSMQYVHNDFIPYVEGIDSLLNTTINNKNYGPDFARAFLYVGMREELNRGFFFGTEFMQRRADICLAGVKTYFPFVYGYLLGKTSYENYHSAELMTTYTQYVLKDGIAKMMKDSPWMTNSSKKNALKKVNFMRLYIGYPNETLNASAVDLFYQNINVRGNWSDMAQVLIAEGVKTFREKYSPFISTPSNEPTDPWPTDFKSPSEFGYWLTGVNAFYTPNANYFTIPVTISQVPYFSVDYPPVANFGSLGIVIGHEISHGFDPQGSMYDFNGTKVNPSIYDNKTFIDYQNRTQCYERAYDKIRIGSEFVNGTLTITENVADNSGMMGSWLAWQEYRKTHPDMNLPGLESWSQEKLFFAIAGRIWCTVARKGYFNNWKDVHAPARARTLGMVMNNPHFGPAFGCPLGTPMNPKDKCSLWWK